MDKYILRKVQLLELEILDEIVRICSKYKLNYFFIAGSLIGAIRHKGFIPWDDDLDIAMPREDYEKFIKICKNELNNRFFLDASEVSYKYYRLAAKIRINNTIYMQKDLIKYQGHQGIWVDILPLDDTNNGKKLKFQAYAKSLLEVAIEYKCKVDISEKKLWKKSISIFVSILPLRFLKFLQKKIMTFDNNKNYEYFVNLASKYDFKKQTFRKKDWIPAKKMFFENKEYNVPNNYDNILRSVYGNYMEIPSKDKQEIHNPVRIKFENGEEYNYEEVQNRIYTRNV